jgi:hypothetical protein
MKAVLADHGLRKNAAVGGNQRDRTIVARGFEAKDYGHFAPVPLPDRGNLH